MSEIITDINAYSGWSQNSSGIAMHGIFLDEVVSEFAPGMPEYMAAINAAAKSAAGLLGERTVS